MARVFGYLLALIYVSAYVSAGQLYDLETVYTILTTISILTAPLETRAGGGGAACNIARLKTVGGLRQATTAVNKLASSK